MVRTIAIVLCGASPGRASTPALGGNRAMSSLYLILCPGTVESKSIQLTSISTPSHPKSARCKRTGPEQRNASWHWGLAFLFAPLRSRGNKGTPGFALLENPWVTCFSALTPAPAVLWTDVHRACSYTSTQMYTQGARLRAQELSPLSQALSPFSPLP